MTLGLSMPRLRLFCGITILLLPWLLAPSFAHGQRPEPGRPGGPGFGPGGPRGRGMGGPWFGGPGGMPAPAIGLLNLSEVQKELSATPEQLKQVEAVGTQLQEKMRAAFESMNFQ